MFCWLLSVPQAARPNSSIITDRHLEATPCCCFHISKNKSTQAGRLPEWSVPGAPSPQKSFPGLPTHLLGLNFVKAATQLSPWKCSKWSMLKGGFTATGIWRHFCHSSLPKIAVGEIETELCCRKQVWVFQLMFGSHSIWVWVHPKAQQGVSEPGWASALKLSLLVDRVLHCKQGTVPSVQLRESPKDLRGICRHGQSSEPSFTHWVHYLPPPPTPPPKKGALCPYTDNWPLNILFMVPIFSEA